MKKSLYLFVFSLPAESFFTFFLKLQCVELSGPPYWILKKDHTHTHIHTHTHCEGCSCCLWSQTVVNSIAKVKLLTSWSGPSCAATAHKSLSYSSLQTQSGGFYCTSAGPSFSLSLFKPSAALLFFKRQIESMNSSKILSEIIMCIR